MPAPTAQSSRWMRQEDGSFVRNYAGVQETATGYDALTKEELADELESRGLTKSGNKDELIARLEEADAEA